VLAVLVLKKSSLSISNGAKLKYLISIIESRAINSVLRNFRCLDIFVN